MDVGDVPHLEGIVEASQECVPRFIRDADRFDFFGSAVLGGYVIAVADNQIVCAGFVSADYTHRLGGEFGYLGVFLQRFLVGALGKVDFGEGERDCSVFIGFTE